MQFSDSANLTGIVEEIDFYINTDSTSYPLKQKARNVNRRLDDVVSIILASDGRWEWDDSNQTDLPIGTSTLVNNQQDYEIAGATFLKITRVEVKDINGNYRKLEPIDQRNITTESLTEFQKTAGKPLFYDKIGDSVFLYPKPSTALVTASAGLKVYFKRIPSYFSYDDTTKTPGFAPLYHRILSVGAALDYAIANEMVNKINILTPIMAKLEQGLIDFYSSRSQDEQARMTPRSENYGAERGFTHYSDKVAF